MSVITFHDHNVRATKEDLYIREIEGSQILHWLKLGWQDFKAAPGLSLLYGILFSLACLATIYLSRSSPGFLLSFVTGLMLLGPLLALGAYTAARQLAAGEPASIGNSMRLLSTRATNLSLFAIFLLLIMVAWIRLSALLFALQFAMVKPTLEAYTSAMLSSPDGLLVLGYFMGIGFILALAVYMASAISIPMIVDRNTDPFTAVQASFAAVWHNKAAMTLWAMMIVMLTGVGIVTGFIAMVVIFPLLGYATWHSYRDAVAPEQNESGT